MICWNRPFSWHQRNGAYFLKSPMEFMEFIIFTHWVFLGALFMWMFKSWQEDKYEARIERVCKELVKYKEKEMEESFK